MLGVSCIKLTRTYRDGRKNSVHIAQQSIVSFEWIEQYNATAVQTTNNTVWVDERPEQFMEALFRGPTTHEVKDKYIE